MPEPIVNLYECHQCHTFTAATRGSCLQCGALNLGPVAEKAKAQLEKTARHIENKIVREMKAHTGNALLDGFINRFILDLLRKP